jgi:uncharacterized ion transporter superfamily protein YfcC
VRHGLCRLVLAATVIGLIVGSTVYSWYMAEFAGLVFATGLACGIAGVPAELAAPPSRRLPTFDL